MNPEEESEIRLKCPLCRTEWSRLETRDQAECPKALKFLPDMGSSGRSRPLYVPMTTSPSYRPSFAPDRLR